MAIFIIRHARENLKKCSLSKLSRSDVFFYTYPDCIRGKEVLPQFTNTVVLDIDGEEFSIQDRNANIIILDATWRLAVKMWQQLPCLHKVPKRRIPYGIETAYPRKQTECSDPLRGLASIEALYVACMLTGMEYKKILDGYYWKDQFLEKNKQFFMNFDRE